MHTYLTKQIYNRNDFIVKILTNTFPFYLKINKQKQWGQNYRYNKIKTKKMEESFVFNIKNQKKSNIY